MNGDSSTRYKLVTVTTLQVAISSVPPNKTPDNFYNERTSNHLKNRLHTFDVPTIPNYEMYTVAGNGIAGSAADNAVATSSSINVPCGVHLDASNSLLFMAEYTGFRVSRLNLLTGALKNFAGTSGTSGSSGDGGQATTARFKSPTGVAGVTSGVIYVSDYVGHKVRSVSVSGIISTAVGTGTASGATTATNGDGGPASSASVNSPNLIVADTSNNLYFADCQNNKLRKVDGISGTISTVVGTGAAGTSGDGGYATSATLNEPADVFVDTGGRIYVTDKTRIRIIAFPSNIISLFAGLSGSTALSNNVPATSSGIDGAFGIWGDTAGNVYYSSSGVGQTYLRAVSAANGFVSTIASNGAVTTSLFISSGPALALPILSPRGVRGDSQGRIFIADSSTATGGSAIRGVYATTQQPTPSPSTTSPPTYQPTAAPTVPEYLMFTAVGTGMIGTAADGAVASASRIAKPQGLAVDATGNYLYFVETGCNRVWKVNLLSGIMNVIAGVYNVTDGGFGGFNGDGIQATAALLNVPHSVCLSSAGDVIVSDSYNYRIRKIGSGGLITTIAGTGVQGTLATSNGDDSAASSATIGLAYQMAFGPSNLFFAESSNNRIRKIFYTTSQIIRTFAGSGVSSSTGDGGSASSATLNAPFGVFVSSAGFCFCSEASGGRIRAILTTDNHIQTLAGGIAVSYPLPENIPSTSCALAQPLSLWGNSMGDLYFVDQGLYRAREINTFAGNVNTIAGFGGVLDGGFETNGVALGMALQSPAGIAGDGYGRIYISDSSNEYKGSNIRGIYVSTQSPTATPTVSMEPTYIPTIAPSPSPSVMPSVLPSIVPSTSPSTVPSIAPSALPSRMPSISPSATPSATPSLSPTILPSFLPTALPSTVPTTAPSTSPTALPSGIPSVAPSTYPTILPSIAPSAIPSSFPTPLPSLSPSTTPTLVPSKVPSILPSASPSNLPSVSPTVVPSSASPSAVPSMEPSAPTPTPSSAPTYTPYQMYTVAGNGHRSFSGTATQPTSMSLGSVCGIYLDILSSSEHLLFTDSDNLVVRMVDFATGVSHVVIGSGDSGDGGDGNQATSAAFVFPFGVIMDQKYGMGDIFVSDIAIKKIRKVDQNSGIISTFAGVGAENEDHQAAEGVDGVPATAAPLRSPRYMAFDSTNNLYFTDGDAATLRKVHHHTAIINTVAGAIDLTWSSGDGGAASASTLNNPFGLYIDSANDIYVAEHYGNVVRRISGSDWTISTFAGSYDDSNTLFIDNVVATAAAFSGPCGIWGNTLGDIYIADQGNSRLRVVSAFYGLVTAIAGSGSTGFFVAAGPALEVPLDSLQSVGVDSAGRVYFAEQYAIRSLFASTMTPSASPSVAPTTAPSSVPTIAPTMEPTNLPTTTTPSVLPSADPTQLPSVTPSTVPSSSPSARPSITPTVSPSEMPSSAPSLVPSEEPSARPSALPSAPPTLIPTQFPSMQPSMSPSLWPTQLPTVCPTTVPTTCPSVEPTVPPSLVPSVEPTTETPSMSPSQLPTRIPSIPPTVSPTASPSVDRSLLISTVAGTGIAGGVGNFGDGGPAMSTTFNRLNGIAVDALGHIYVADSLNNVVRKINAFTDFITTIARDTTSSLTRIGDGGPATSATLSGPKHLFVEATGRFLFVSDPGNFAVSRIDLQSGIIALFAGSNIMPIAPSSGTGDGGPATSAMLKNPYGLWGDTMNNLYISDNSYNNIRKVDTNGIISTIAGSVSGADGSSGNNSPATSALLFGPIGLWGDSSNHHLYVCDYSNVVIRRVDLNTGIISLFAGQTGLPGASGDNGAATSAKLKSTISIWGDANRNVYLSDAGNCGLRKVSGSGGIISKLSGVYGVCTGQGDNGSPAISATHKFVYQITGNRANTLYLADGSMRKVRVIYNATHTLSPITAPTAVPSILPTSAVPTMSPSQMPTSIQPTRLPSLLPSHLPTLSPSRQPSSLPVPLPTATPSFGKSQAPQWSQRPTKSPSFPPTKSPSSAPTTSPTKSPTSSPTAMPSQAPTTVCPSNAPSAAPSVSAEPSVRPSHLPTCTPTTSVEPSCSPSEAPTHEPTVSVEPSAGPTASPSTAPSATPQPSETPSVEPSSAPTIEPTCAPSEAPSSEPTVHPSTEPLGETTTEPSTEPLCEPSQGPSTNPTVIRTVEPTETPTVMEETSAQPSQLPTHTPSRQPLSTIAPSIETTALPSATPTTAPPTLRLTASPTVLLPSNSPTWGQSASRAPTSLNHIKTLTPTSTSTVAPTLPVVHITVGGEIELSSESVSYIIELRENDEVTFTASHVHTNNSRIVREYKVIPVDAVRIEIETFNSRTDLINLSAFESYTKFTDLHITQGSVIINLPNSQVIKLLNLSPADVSSFNFLFSSGSTNTNTNNKSSAAMSSVTIGIVSAVVVLVGGGVLWALFWYVHKTRALSKKVASLTPIFPVIEKGDTNNNHSHSIMQQGVVGSGTSAKAPLPVQSLNAALLEERNHHLNTNMYDIDAAQSVDSLDLENFDLRSEEDDD